MQTICVIGLGYIGLPTASLFANNGLKVLGVDSNPEVVSTLNGGNIHIDEVGLRTLVEAAIASGNLKCSVTPAHAEAFIVSVPTPINADKSADLSYVFDALDAIAPHLVQGNLVVIESTVPPGTTRRCSERLASLRSDLVQADGELMLHLAHCPERVLPGQILKELVENERVIGGLTAEATRTAESLYKKIVASPICTTDATTAEMVKLAENTFRDVNIALSNELSVICEKTGINVWEVIRLANNHPRVRLLKPGPGVGGHCIAVDPWFIASQFPEDAKIIRAAREQNDAMPKHVAVKVSKLLAGISPCKVACLGASYKANVGDARNSPAIEVFNLIRSSIGNRGVVTITDPHINHAKFPIVTLDEALDDADVIVVLTDHDEYTSLNPLHVANKVRRKVVLDTRNCLDRMKWADAGFATWLVGDGSRQ